MTFTDSAFAGQYLIPVNTLTLINSESSASGVFTLSSPGENVTGGQTFTDVFNVAPVPEPSTQGFASLALFALGILGFRTSRRSRLETE